ncbi:MAG: zinc ribbon domain-containing protein [Candidatus Acidiferrales bacterium]
MALPLYEYKCVKCGHRFEKIESVSASETKKCPRCRSRAVRQISSSAIQFKGSGWYATDYATKSPAPASGEKSGEGDSPKPQEKPATAQPADSKSSAEKGAQKKKK